MQIIMDHDIPVSILCCPQFAATENALLVHLYYQLDAAWNSLNTTFFFSGKREILHVVLNN